MKQNSKRPDWFSNLFGTIMRSSSRAETKYLQILEMMNEGLGIVDADFAFTYVNSRFCRMLGYTFGEMAGHHITEFLDEENKGIMTEQIAKRKKRQADRYNLVWTAKDGRMVYTIVSPRGLFDQQGSFLGSFGIVTDITEYKLAQEELRRSEERYALAQRAANIGSWDWDIKTGRLIWSEQIEPMFGFDKGRFTGTHQAFLECVHPEDRELVENSINASLEEGKEYGIEHRIVWPDGTVRWVSEAGSVFRDENGKAARMLGVVRDITERKHAQQKLNLNNLAISQASGGIVITTHGKTENPIIYVNPSFERITGYSLQEVMGRDCRFLQGDDSEQPQLDEIRQALRQQRGCRVILRNYRKDGSLFWNELSISPVRNEQCRLTHYVGVITDITDRKKAEEQLQKAHEELDNRVKQRTIELAQTNEDLQNEINNHKRTEEELASERNLMRTLIDNMPDFIYVKDTKSRFTLCNTALCRNAGAEFPDELIGKTDFDFFERHLAEQFYADEQEIIRSGKPMINKEEPGTDPANPTWVLTTKVPFRDAYGKIVGIVGIGRDITERRLAKDALQRARDELEAHVQQRTADLAKVNAELESILYVASHDLRSPLVNIQGFSHELSQSCQILRSCFSDKQIASRINAEARVALDEAIPEALGFILASAGKMDAVLLGLLRLSRLGREATNIESLDMNAVIAGIVDSMEYQAKEAPAVITVETLPACLGDASQINQVFSNLLDNAIKYLDHSRPGLVRISGTVQQGHSVYCVEDNGIGISPDHQERTFEAFHRLEPERAWGEGLGLTIVRRILDRHNGKVWIESEPGRGSKFFVSLQST